jgi:hypothetical protein
MSEVRDREAFPRWASAGLLLLVGVGLALRARYLVAGTWAWGDEALLMLYIREESFLGIVTGGGFRNLQLAPALFFWTLKLLAMVFGTYRCEVLRLPALVSGVVTLVGTAWLGRRVLAPWGALAATGVVAFCAPLAKYTWEVKPYGSDATVTLVVLAAVLLPAGSGLLRPLPRGLWIAALLPWISFTSVLALPGMLGEAYRRDTERPRGQLVRLLLLLGVSAVLCIAWTWKAKQAVGQFMDGFWAFGFPPPGAGAADAVRWFWGQMLGVMEYVVDLDGPWYLGPALATTGLVASARGDRKLLLVAISTIGLWTLASLARVYPMVWGATLLPNRLSLFIIPLVAFLIGAGVSATERALPRWVAPVLVVWLLYRAAPHELAPVLDMSYRSSFERVLREGRAGDLLGATEISACLWKLHVLNERIPADFPVRRVLVGVWGDSPQPDYPPPPPEVRRVWVLETREHGVNQSGWVETVRGAGFRPAATPRPEGPLELWVRDDVSAAPGSTLASP